MLQWISGLLPWKDDLDDHKKVNGTKQCYMCNVPAFINECFSNKDHQVEIVDFVFTILILCIKTNAMSIEIKLNANLMTCTFISTDIVFELMLKIVAGLHFDETLNNLKFKKLLVLKPVADFCQFQVSDFGGKKPTKSFLFLSNMLCDKQK